MTSALERFAVDIDELEVETPADAAVDAVRDILRGRKFNPNHEPAGSPIGGQFASDPGGGGTAVADLTVETVSGQTWADDWRAEFLAMMKEFGATDEIAEKLVGTVQVPESDAVRVRDADGNQVYVVARSGTPDADMRRIGRYAMEAMQRDPAPHLANGRAGKHHLQISIVDQVSTNDDSGILAQSGWHGMDIEFKPRALTLKRGNRGEWMPASEEGDLLRYLIAHEYGHIRASEKYKPGSMFVMPKFRASRYALTDPNEAYAEAYAQWVLDKSVVPELAEIAKSEGWPGA